jgi:hypothetical protein
MYGGFPIRAMSAFLGTNQLPILSVNFALATVKQDRQVLPLLRRPSGPGHYFYFFTSADCGLRLGTTASSPLFH